MKVGHKQVVSLIRQGGNRLLMKVVSVTRKPESEEVVRKKGKNQRIWSFAPSLLRKRVVVKFIFSHVKGHKNRQTCEL